MYNKTKLYDTAPNVESDDVPITLHTSCRFHKNYPRFPKTVYIDIPHEFKIKKIAYFF